MYTDTHAHKYIILDIHVCDSGIYRHIYIDISTHDCMYVCMYACMYVCMHLRVCINIYVYVHTYLIMIETMEGDTRKDNQVSKQKQNPHQSPTDYWHCDHAVIVRIRVQPCQKKNTLPKSPPTHNNYAIHKVANRQTRTCQHLKPTAMQICG